MSGKAKTAQKAGGKDRGPNDTGYKHEKPTTVLVLRFERNAKGNVAPKARFQREDV